MELCTYLSLSYIIELNAHWSPDSTPLHLAEVHNTSVGCNIGFSILHTPHSLLHTHSVTKHTGLQRCIDGKTCILCLYAIDNKLCLFGLCQIYLVWSQVWFSLMDSHKVSETNDCDCKCFTVKGIFVEKWVSNTILFDMNLRELLKRVHYTILLVRKS